MAKKYTVFQSLDRAISGNWSSIEQPHVNAYDMRNYGGGDKVLYKTTNKDEYEENIPDTRPPHHYGWRQRTEAMVRPPCVVLA